MNIALVAQLEMGLVAQEHSNRRNLHKIYWLGSLSIAKAYR